MNARTPRLGPTLLAAALALSLAACGNKEEKKVATQVAAKVGSEEISVHQINQVLSRANTASANPDAAKTLSRDILEKLIDQQLAVDQALDAKLHRSPEVVSQIEAARREILARAYIQQLSAAQPKPSPEETQKYFIDNPQLFSQRRIFNVQEIIVSNAAADLPALTEQLRAHAAAGKPMEEVATWLKDKNVKFAGGSATRPAEQIPLELLAQIHPLKDGQSTVITTPQGVTLLRLASSQTVPVDQAAALPRIEQFLSNQRTGEAVAAQLKQLRANTTVTYMGEFAANPLDQGVAGLK